MTLTEFLLARIAEDEEGAWDWHWLGCDTFLCPNCSTGPFPCDCPAPARVRAECVAKRRIVDQVSDFQLGGHAVRDVILMNLALPYANHPDYRDEWRP